MVSPCTWTSNTTDEANEHMWGEKQVEVVMEAMLNYCIICSQDYIVGHGSD